MTILKNGHHLAFMSAIGLLVDKCISMPQEYSIHHVSISFCLRAATAVLGPWSTLEW